MMIVICHYIKKVEKKNMIHENIHQFNNSIMITIISLKFESEFKFPFNFFYT